MVKLTLLTLTLLTLAGNMAEFTSGATNVSLFATLAPQSHILLRLSRKPHWLDSRFCLMKVVFLSNVSGTLLAEPKINVPVNMTVSGIIKCNGQFEGSYMVDFY